MRCSRSIFFLIAIALIASLNPSAFAQTAPAIVIKHHQRIPDLTFDAPNSARAPAPNAPQQMQQLSITAFGKTFLLELEENGQLIANLPTAQQQRLAQKMRLFRGQLTGVKNSWVRLTRNGSRLSGMIWDGSEMFVIDQSDEMAKSLTAPEAGSYPLMYRLNDVTWSNAQCALDPAAKPMNDYRALVQELNTLAQALPATARELPVAIVADAQFVQSNSLDPEAAVVARMNVVDGIYSEQVSVHLRIAQIRSLQSNGTLTATNPGSLLDQFSAYASAPGFTNPGLAHLFTGKNLDGNVIGIAYLGSLCSARFGTGLSQTTGTGTAGALIVAHELGHNFGAPHDAQSGSSCAGAGSGFIMNPSANGSRTFSTCSVQQMQPEIAGAACITPVAVASADLRPALPVNPISAQINTNFTYRVEVRNGGAIAATASTVTIAIPNGLQLQSASVTQGTCSSAATQVSCSIGNIAAAATQTATLTLRGAGAGSFTSNISVAATNDGNPGNNTTQALINLGGTTGSATIFQAHFDTGSDGFTYVDNAFRSSRQAAYASGSRLATGGFSGGGLNVVLGAIDNNDILNMSGAWQRTFTLPAQRHARVSLRFKLTQSASYEADELSQALLAIDGRLVSYVAGRDFLTQVAGNGDGGSAVSTGWRQVTVDLGVLAAGTHTLMIGGFNNKKTDTDERTIVYIDDVSVIAR
jgi:uncharacterized repeat protein (TIGR01451 family)